VFFRVVRVVSNSFCAKPGLRDCQHWRAAFRTICLFNRWGLTNDKSPFGDSQFFKISFNFHLAFYRKENSLSVMRANL